MGLTETAKPCEKTETPSILTKIQELKHMCKGKGRTPIILLISKRRYSELARSLAAHELCNVSAVVDLTVIICAVNDFLVVDDRHWYEQTF